MQIFIFSPVVNNEILQKPEKNIGGYKHIRRTAHDDIKRNKNNDADTAELTIDTGGS